MRRLPLAKENSLFIFSFGTLLILTVINWFVCVWRRKIYCLGFQEMLRIYNPDLCLYRLSILNKWILITHILILYGGLRIWIQFGLRGTQVGLLRIFLINWISIHSTHVYKRYLFWSQFAINVTSNFKIVFLLNETDNIYFPQMFLVWNFITNPIKLIVFKKKILF